LVSAAPVEYVIRRFSSFGLQRFLKRIYFLLKEILDLCCFGHFASSVRTDGRFEFEPPTVRVTLVASRIRTPVPNASGAHAVLCQLRTLGVVVGPHKKLRRPATALELFELSVNRGVGVSKPGRESLRGLDHAVHGSGHVFFSRFLMAPNDTRRIRMRLVVDEGPVLEAADVDAVDARVEDL
jgi:hypothetical protein